MYRVCDYVLSDCHWFVCHVLMGSNMLILSVFLFALRPWMCCGRCFAAHCESARMQFRCPCAATANPVHSEPNGQFIVELLVGTVHTAHFQLQCGRQRVLCSPWPKWWRFGYIFAYSASVHLRPLSLTAHLQTNQRPDRPR